MHPILAGLALTDALLAVTEEVLNKPKPAFRVSQAFDCRDRCPNRSPKEFFITPAGVYMDADVNVTRADVLTAMFGVKAGIDVEMDGQPPSKQTGGSAASNTA